MTTTLEELANELARRDPFTSGISPELIYSTLKKAYELGQQESSTEDVKYPQRTKSELLGYARDLGAAQRKEDNAKAELTYSTNWIHLTDKAYNLGFTHEDIEQLLNEYIHGYDLLSKA